MDDAVTFNLPDAPLPGFGIPDPLIIAPIEDALVCGFLESYDTAFELDTDPNYIKWEQPFTGLRHWPHYEDVKSMAIEPPDGTLQHYSLVADDWPCRRTTPITAVVWWGSYIGYGYEACTCPLTKPRKPDYFLLSIWDNIPAGVDPCVPFSHPNEPIWKYKAYNYNEVLVGFDKHPHGEPNEPVFRYSVRLPRREWFFQKKVEDVYWLSIVAVYSDETRYPWGWTNHRHVFEDDAVIGFLDDPGPVPADWTWKELYDQAGNSEDMSFVLFTDPNPILGTCWDPFECAGQPSGDATCDGWVNLGDLLALKAAWGDTVPWADPNCCADFDHSGAVNLGDLLGLKAGWGTGPYVPSTGSQSCP
jgi:hypothetical protein